MSRRATLVPLLALLSLLAGACAHAPRGRVIATVSSVGSDYSPQLRVAVHTALSPDSIVLRVDSGTLLAPGEPAGGGRPLMRRVTMEALVVTASAPRPPDADRAAAPPPPPWTAIATSAPLPLADSLYIGVTHAVRPMRFAVARPPALDPSRAWLVFRIRAEGVATPVRLADGTLLPGRDVPDGVRVFACSDRNLLGARDRRRARRLREAYLAAC